jgi:hypothetical protein
VAVQQRTCNIVSPATRVYVSPNLDRPRFEHPLHHISIRTQHASVMNAESTVKKSLHLLVTRLSNIPPEELPLRVIFTTEIANPMLLLPGEPSQF